MKKLIEALRERLKQTDKRALLLRIGMIVLCAAVLIGLIYLAFGQAIPELIPLLRSGDEEKIAAYLGSQNRISGILSTALLAFLQPISIILPGAPIQIAAGIVYGTLKGFLICHISYVISNLVVFYLARVLGQKMDRYVSRFSEKVNFLQDAQYPAYMTAIGKRILHGEYFYAAGLLIFCLLVVIVLTLLRRQVVQLMHKVGQQILSWLRKADAPHETHDIPPLQDDLP